ncbi:MAG: PAS domain S-box protein [Gammaproteobacteria bacterium]|nr:MAG: PAS domain S-box protein [Gammaproteobacteria bacterium]
MYLEQIFEHSSEAMLLIDPDQDVLLAANRAATNLLGYERQQLMSLRPGKLFGENRANLIVFTDEVLYKGKAWTNDIEITDANGKQLKLEISASSFTAQANHAKQCLISLILRDSDRVAHLYDVSEANRVHRGGLEKWKTIEGVFQEIERKNQLILGAAGEGIYGVNADGETTFVNPAAERMLGWTAEELSGKNIHKTVHHSHEDGSHYAGKECPIYAAFRDGEIHHVDNEVFWRKDGSSFPVEYTSTPITDNGRLVGAVVVFRDISERRQAEAQLRQALNQVEALKARLEMENAYLQEEIREGYSYKEIVGKSAAINNIIHQIELVARTDANVLISGESGTGKELIARAIHDASNRRNRPLIRVNCASIPRDLFESEFFGHVKGAFTGAVKDRAGRFELADGGTLFLDEVGEIPPELQSKLLRVLQEQQFERVGDNQTQHVDVRIIAATNRDLKKEVEKKNFREDLYFRLNVFPIISPSLRERLEDVPLLASHFLFSACHKFNKPELTISISDMRRLQSYPWPGNIRELVNVVERGVILSEGGRIRIDLPEVVPLQQNVIADLQVVQNKQPALLTDSERNMRDRDNIIRALKASQGRIFGKGGAAELLCVKPTTLASRIKRLHINKSEFERHTIS